MVLLLGLIGCVHRVPVCFQVLDVKSVEPIAGAEVRSMTRRTTATEVNEFALGNMIQATWFGFTGQAQFAQGLTDLNGTVILNIPY